MAGLQSRHPPLKSRDRCLFWWSGNGGRSQSCWTGYEGCRFLSAQKVPGSERGTVARHPSWKETLHACGRRPILPDLRFPVVNRREFVRTNQKSSAKVCLWQLPWNIRMQGHLKSRRAYREKSPMPCLVIRHSWPSPFRCCTGYPSEVWAGRTAVPSGKQIQETIYHWILSYRKYVDNH